VLMVQACVSAFDTAAMFGGVFRVEVMFMVRLGKDMASRDVDVLRFGSCQ
jgi:hypothetical protein